MSATRLAAQLRAFRPMVEHVGQVGLARAGYVVSFWPGGWAPDRGQRVRRRQLAASLPCCGRGRRSENRTIAIARAAASTARPTSSPPTSRVLNGNVAAASVTRTPRALGSTAEYGLGLALGCGDTVGKRPPGEPADVVGPGSSPRCHAPTPGGTVGRIPGEAWHRAGVGRTRSRRGRRGRRRPVLGRRFRGDLDGAVGGGRSDGVAGPGRGGEGRLLARGGAAGHRDGGLKFVRAALRDPADLAATPAGRGTHGELGCDGFAGDLAADGHRDAAGGPPRGPDPDREAARPPGCTPDLVVMGWTSRQTWTEDLVLVGLGEGLPEPDPVGVGEGEAEALLLGLDEALLLAAGGRGSGGAVAGLRGGGGAAGGLGGGGGGRCWWLWRWRWRWRAERWLGFGGRGGAGARRRGSRNCWTWPWAWGSWRRRTRPRPGPCRLAGRAFRAAEVGPGAGRTRWGRRRSWWRPRRPRCRQEDRPRCPTRRGPRLPGRRTLKIQIGQISWPRLDRHGHLRRDLACPLIHQIARARKPFPAAGVQHMRPGGPSVNIRACLPHRQNIR